MSIFGKERKRTGPEECSRCKRRRCHWRHGSFTRTAEGLTGSREIKIQRYICKECGKTVSELPEGLVPRRHYRLDLIARGVEEYATRATSYRLTAGRLPGVSVSQVFEWVKLILSRAASLLQDVQRWCVCQAFDENVEDALIAIEAVTCPNAWKARVPGKEELLNTLSRLVGQGEVALSARRFGEVASRGSILEELGKCFLNDVDGLQQIFAHHIRESTLHNG